MARTAETGSRSGRATRWPAAPGREGSAIARLFPNQALLDVLAILLLHPEEEFYQREIALKTGRTLVEAQRALRRIEDAGLLRARRRGNRVYYAAQRGHPAFEDIKRLLLKTVALGDALRDGLAPLREKVRIAFVFGSVASGTESPSSDIDLFVVGGLSSRRLASVLGRLGRQLGREFNPVLYPPAELRQKAKAGNHFVQQVLAGPKIWLIGSDDVLARLVE